MTDPILEQIVAAARKRWPDEWDICLEQRTFWYDGDDNYTQDVCLTVQSYDDGDYPPNITPLVAPDLPALLSKLEAEDGA